MAVGIGVIGTGSFGRKHVAAYSDLPQARVVAVYDANRERADAVAREFGVDAVCESVQALVERPDVEAVSIVTSEDQHLEPALAVLAAGKPVMVEKPLATSVEEARTLVDAAEASRGFLLPGHLLRFELHYATIYERVQSGEFGQLITLTARRNRTFGLFETYQRTHPALETMIHDIDLALWYVGERPTKIHAWARNSGGYENPNVLKAVLEFPGGVLATLDTFWTLPDNGGMAIDDALQLVGLDMTASLDFSRPALVTWGKDGANVPELNYEPVLMGRGVGALREELAYFVDCVASGREPTRVTAADGLAAVEVARAVIETAAKREG